MLDAIKKILDIARTEIGTTELPGEDVKYNTEYYGGRVKNHELYWCAVFVWWLFRHAGMADLYFGGLETASCTTLYSYHAGQKVSEYQPGDIIFYNFKGGTKLEHVGICESWDGKHVTTIEGNTGSGSQSNGDGVYRKVRPKSQIVAAYRPRYDLYDIKKEDDIDMTEENIRAIRAIVAEEMDKRFPVYKSVAEVPEWGRPAVQRMIDRGYVKGDGAGKLHITPDYLLAIITQDRAMEVTEHG